MIAALNPEVAAEVRNLVLHPPEDTPYDHLRLQLIKQTEASEQRRLQQYKFIVSVMHRITYYIYIYIYIYIALHTGSRNEMLFAQQ